MWGMGKVYIVWLVIVTVCFLGSTLVGISRPLRNQFPPPLHLPTPTSSDVSSAPLNLHAPHEEVSHKPPTVPEKANFIKKLFFSSCLHKVQRPAGTSVLWEHACSTWQARPRQVPRCLLRGAMTKAEIQRCYLRSQLHPGSEVPFKGDVLESEHTPLHLLLGFIQVIPELPLMVKRIFIIVVPNLQMRKLRFSDEITRQKHTGARN